MGNREDFPFEAMFLEGVKGRLFGLFFPAVGTPSGNLLCIPPFTEESNRSRVMLGMACRALAQEGWSTLMLDLYGCGDSEGEFEDADWETWMSDIGVGLEWLASRNGPLGLWGTRLGALQAVLAAERHADRIEHLLLWQPVPSGKLFFTQYLRLRVANSLDTYGRQETTKELRERLASGETLEIGGYYITPRMAADLDAAAMPSQPRLGDTLTHWIERVDEGKTELSVGSRKIIDRWQEAGAMVTTHTFTGPPFWQLHERFLAPELIEKTLEALRRNP